MLAVEQRKPRGRPRLILLGFVLFILVGLVSCSFGPVPENSTTKPSNYQGTPEQLRHFYQQGARWQPCETGMLCNNVSVPLDYAVPEGQTINLAVIKLPAKGTRQGTLVMNPGGPGSSGYDLVAQNAQEMFSSSLREHYDIVGYDPRGVKRSSPVVCLDDRERDMQRQTQGPDPDKNYDQAVASARHDTEECRKKTGPILGHVDTISSAKDLDILRSTLDMRSLDYLGFSYGTKLGVTYAELFPQRVGKFVLDGALDPTLTLQRLVMGQAKGFETAFRTWTEHCLSTGDCPLRGSVDQAVRQVQELNSTYEKNPAKTTSGRVLTGAEFNAALALGLYTQKLWPALQRALTQAVAGRADGMLALADQGADRDPKSGSYTSNAPFAFTAINCLDYSSSSDKSALQVEAAELQKVSPTFGKYLGYSGLSCSSWPYPPNPMPHRNLSLLNTAPIVVIGTTGDPATPYSWAVSLHQQLPKSVLVTWEGNGHTAYGQGNTCIADAVDRYFLNGTLPSQDLHCR